MYFCDLCNLSTILTFLSRESVAKLLQRLFEQGLRVCFYVLPGVVSIILEREHAHFSLKDFLEDQQEASHCRSERYQQHRAYSHRVGETLVTVPYTPDVKMISHDDTSTFTESRKYEGHSICNGTRPINPNVLYLHILK